RSRPALSTALAWKIVSMSPGARWATDRRSLCGSVPNSVRLGDIGSIEAGEALREQIEPALDFGLGDDERRDDADHVAGGAVDQQAETVETLLQLGGAVGEAQAEHQPATADLGDPREAPRQRLESGAQLRAARLDRIEQAVFQRVEQDERGAAHQRTAGEGRAVVA